MAFPINATFIDEITYDIPTQNWSNKKWINDLDNMLRVGIDTVVIMRGVFYNKCIYPSKVFPTLKDEDDDFLDLILRECEARDMKVYLGLYISNLDWSEGDSEHEIEMNKLYLDEVLSRYGHYRSLVGWYLPHETGSNIYSIKEVTTGLCKLLKSRTPDKKILISPFFRTKCMGATLEFTPERTYREWDKVFEECGQYIDICAFQDGTVSLERYSEYLSVAEKICDKYDIELWANVETFERDVRSQFYPIPFDVLKAKIKIAKHYVSGMITFEFSHFLSPQSMYESARNLNELYVDYYSKR